MTRRRRPARSGSTPAGMTPDASVADSEDVDVEIDDDDESDQLASGDPAAEAAEVVPLLDHEPTSREAASEPTIVREDEVSAPADSVGDDDEAPIVVTAPSEPTYVYPKITKPVRIGPKWYDFHAGVRISVPDEIIPHLRNTGVI